MFVKVNQALHSFRNESQLSTWIYQIATNTATDKVRSASFKQSSAKVCMESDIDMIAGRGGSAQPSSRC
ncbi:MAG: sigma factor [Negativicutes bacterium]|nr:sigma factor [Negativicutes bacterium]